MTPCTPVERKETACRPHGCHRYDCELNKVTYEQALKRYKKYYPDQYKNLIISKMNNIIHNQSMQDVQRLGKKEVKQ